MPSKWDAIVFFLVQDATRNETRFEASVRYNLFHCCFHFVSTSFKFNFKVVSCLFMFFSFPFKFFTNSLWQLAMNGWGPTKNEILKWNCKVLPAWILIERQIYNSHSILFWSTEILYARYHSCIGHHQIKLHHELVNHLLWGIVSLHVQTHCNHLMLTLRKTMFRTWLHQTPWTQIMLKTLMDTS